MEETIDNNNEQQANDDRQYAQMYNGDAYVNPETGKSYAEELYPNAEEDVACLGTD